MASKEERRGEMMEQRSLSRSRRGGKSGCRSGRRKQRLWWLGITAILFLLCIRLVSVLITTEGGGRLEDVLNAFGGKSNEALTKELSEQGVPRRLLELLERNPETEQFVRDYVAKKEERGRIDVSGEIKRGQIPLFIQWDERWGYRYYGGDFMALNGCGPTCLAMVRCGLGGDSRWNPYKVAQMAEKEGYYVKGEGTSWSLMTDGAREIGLTAEQVTFSEEGIRNTLAAGHPIICVVGPGDFTTAGHYLVLIGLDEEGRVRLCDPNSRQNSEKTWEVSRLMSQIRNLWAYYYES